MRTAEQNADEFRALTRQGKDLRLALLVACSVERRAGQGARQQLLSDQKEVAARKISGLSFAERAGTTAARILLHLDKWNELADKRNDVPHADTLTPDDVESVELGDEAVRAWEKQAFYDKGRAVTNNPAAVGQALTSPDFMTKVLDKADEATRVGIAAAVADMIAGNPDIARTIAADPAAHVAVAAARNRIDDEKGARDPAALERDRERKRRAENGPGLVELLDLAHAVDRLADVAKKFITPDEGPGPYRDNARIQVEAALAKGRAAFQHIEDVMNGALDTRVPDDISELVTE